MSKFDPIINSEDYIDSRDVQERIEYLESEEGLDADERVELESLNNLKTQYVDSFGESSWEFGAQFIRDSYFEDYAQEFAEDCGLVNGNATWPNDCIDWEQAARELKMDYTEFTFDGIEYQAREA